MGATPVAAGSAVPASLRSILAFDRSEEVVECLFKLNSEQMTALTADGPEYPEDPIRGSISLQTYIGKLVAAHRDAS
ncbi:hypothetical protein Kim5_PB00115 (plasmid) [Rhizobium sp. Kim5]|nr:hypothetical protein Kim5_PB00115 [Rhizobium sp. Kim5]